MPANTTKGWPYILPTDNVADYPVTSQALATLLESSVPYRICDGAAAVVCPSPASLAVTFPAGLFTLTPMVVISKGATVGKGIAQAQAITTAGFTAAVVSADGTALSGTATLMWIAIQATPTLAFSEGITPDSMTEDEIFAAEREGLEEWDEMQARLRGER